MAMAFVMAHPGVTSAILGPRTMQQLDDLLAGAEVRLNDEILDQIDQIVPPGIDVGAEWGRLQSTGDPESRTAPPSSRRARRRVIQSLLRGQPDRNE